MSKREYHCETCGQSVWRTPGNVKARVFCSKDCFVAGIAGKSPPCGSFRGSDHPCWKGGRRLRSDGYVYVHRPDHPNAEKGGYILEHRLVMSELLGRPLLAEEHIHHRNGDKADNRPENLELTDKASHAAMHLPEKRLGSHPRGWARLGHGCIDCGTTESRHWAKGRCYRCYYTEVNRVRLAAAKESRRKTMSESQP